MWVDAVGAVLHANVNRYEDTDDEKRVCHAIVKEVCVCGENEESCAAAWGMKVNI